MFMGGDETSMSSMALVQDFLGQKRLAVVGVSRKPDDFSRKLFCELRDRGYDVVPVNPEVDEIDGKKCFAHLQDVQPPVDGALLMTSPAVSDRVVEECARAGIGRVWMYRAGGAGAVSSQAMRFCESHGISVIPGECPLMFLPQGHWFHRLHGLVRKITGRYPR
jgi:predicted CoA-binding protein